ncbi:unnamed protein product, partial [Discosporangium mesarthrocarpum]
GRHTASDWSHLDLSRFPRLQDATANEVILRAGEALYVPESWIHFIVNIGVSAQCNCRSGKSYLYSDVVLDCEDVADREGLE